jgi:hypothetical protein
MAAVVTHRLKKQLLDTIYTEITGATERYYVAIGRSEAWDSSETVPTPTDSFRTERNFRLSSQSLKKVVDVSYVIPRHNWTTGTLYSAYDDSYVGVPTNAHYVLTEDNQVYLCLRQGKNAQGTSVTSTVKPTGTSALPLKTSDGYVWKFMYALTGATSTKFLSSNFMPVQFITDSAGDPSLSSIDVLQATVQEAAVKGQVINAVVTDGGSGYTSAPSITFEGNGTGAAATAFVHNGVVVKIEMDSSADSALSLGKNYDYANIKFSGGGGTGAKARVNLSHDSGIGANPIIDLRSPSLMLNVKPAGAENGDFIVANQDFRQIALIKTPTRHADSAYTPTTGRALRYLELTSVSDAGSFSRDVTITGSTSGAQALIDDIDSDRLYVHQNEDTGFTKFVEGEAITGGGQTGSLTAAGEDSDTDAFYNDDIDQFSGSILYVENRAPVERTTTQTEDIKAVITL